MEETIQASLMADINHLLSQTNLEDYDLDDIELTDEDKEAMLRLTEKGYSVEQAVDEVLYDIRQVLDMELEDHELD